MTDQPAALAAAPAVARPEPVWFRLPTVVGYVLVFGLGAAAVAPFSAEQSGGSSVSAPDFGANTGTSGTSTGGSDGTGATGTGALAGTGSTGAAGTGGATTGTGGATTGTSGATTGAGTTGTGTTGAGPTSLPSTAAPQRVASDVGVTKDGIKIGYVNVNCKTCNTIGIASSAEGENYAKAYVADINARGGINGRKVQLYTEEYDPVADAVNGGGGYRAKCIDLTENIKIWMLVGGFTDANCFAGEHKTPIIQGGQPDIDDPKDFNRLGGRVWSIAPSYRRTLTDWVAKIDSLHLLTGAGTKFSVVYAEPTGAAVDTYLLPLLKSRGLTPTRVKNLGTDLASQSANISQEVAAEKAAGITHVVFATVFAYGKKWTDEAKRDQFNPKYLVGDYGGNGDEYGASQWGGGLPAGSIAISFSPRTTDAQKAATPFGKACVDTWKKRSGRAVPTGGLDLLLEVCSEYKSFERSATAAGVNPTRANWIQAMAHFGTFDTPLFDGGTATWGGPYPFGPVRWSAADQTQESVYTAKCPRAGEASPCWVPLGPIQKMAA